MLRVTCYVLLTFLHLTSISSCRFVCREAFIIRWALSYMYVLPVLLRGRGHRYRQTGTGTAQAGSMRRAVCATESAGQQTTHSSMQDRRQQLPLSLHVPRAHERSAHVWREKLLEVQRAIRHIRSRPGPCRGTVASVTIASVTSTICTRRPQRVRA